MIDTWSASRWWSLLYLNSWQHTDPLLQVYPCLLQRLMRCGLRVPTSICKIPPHRKHQSNRLMNIRTVVQISNKLCFLTSCPTSIPAIVLCSPIVLPYHALICGTMMATFMLDAVPVNTTFRSALLKVIIKEHSEIFLGVRMRIMDDLNCYVLWVILTATSKSEKCWSPKSFLSFKTFMVLSFNGIMSAICGKVCERLIFNRKHTTSFVASLFVWYVTYWICVGFHWSASRS